MSHGAQLGAAVALIWALTGCRPSGQGAAASTTAAGATKAEPVSITITASDFAFDAPAEVPAGPVTMRLENHGKEMHQAQLIKLEDGKTLQDFAAATKNPGPPPPWVRFVGGPNGVSPGGQSNATSVLEPGQYAYVCFIPGMDGKPHVVKGMVRPFRVTAASSTASGELPAADVTIRLVDYDFQTSGAITPGSHTIKVENGGPQAHELVLLRLAPGKKTEDFARWAETGMKGQPPAEPVGGVVALEKGGQATFTVDLTAGDYGLICFVPDSKDGKMHLAHGMMKDFKVS